MALPGFCNVKHTCSHPVRNATSDSMHTLTLKADHDTDCHIMLIAVMLNQQKRMSANND